MAVMIIRLCIDFHAVNIHFRPINLMKAEKRNTRIYIYPFGRSKYPAAAFQLSKMSLILAFSSVHSCIVLQVKSQVYCATVNGFCCLFLSVSSYYNITFDFVVVAVAVFVALALEQRAVHYFFPLSVFICLVHTHWVHVRFGLVLEKFTIPRFTELD